MHEKGIETEETLEHLLVECDHYKEERKKIEKKIIGEDKWRDIKEEEKEMAVIIGLDPENILGIEYTKSTQGNYGKEQETIETINNREHNYYKENTTI